VAPAVAHAADTWTFTPEATTTPPVDAGVRLTAEAPMRLRLSIEFGILPGPYVDATNGVPVGFGACSKQHRDLIESVGDRNSAARQRVRDFAELLERHLHIVRVFVDDRCRRGVCVLSAGFQ
jgi:hypothetical protein